MNSPQFKGKNVVAYSEKMFSNQLESVSLGSAANLRISKALLFFGIILVVLNNLSLIEPGNYFGAFSWVTVAVFLIGIFINFVSIPALYFSSLKNFKREIDFWDKEVFWILPLFFFGTFFLYNSQIAMSLVLFIVSVIVISIVHVRFFIEAKKIISDNMSSSLCDHGQYFVSLKYLTACYVLLLLVLFVYDPLKHLFFWIRTQV